MKIVCLNIWKGKLLPELVAFIQSHAPTTDIFCFQEMVTSLDSSGERVDVFGIIAKSLPGFQGFFEAAQDYESGLVEEGLAIFVKRSDPIDKEGDFFVYRTRNAMINDDGRTLGRNIQFMQFSKSGKEFAIINFHGLWTGDGRGDTPERIGQSQKLKAFLNLIQSAKIVCGDFNLSRDTQSMAIIEAGMKNLIKEHHITSTRNRFFEYPDKFAGYILVDPDVNITNFQVIQNEVSDHLPLVLEFE
ncbi:MAG: hypothetical protein HY007_02750 [Candidatus Sungbacteria bacterium]|nr:hypothetical protein [Candidatus Sungbacteria bacterium]